MEASLSHVALLLPSVEKAAQVLNGRGIETCVPEIFPAEGTKEIYVGSYAEQKGLLLLLEAISEGPYERALLKRGPSLHHIALDVLDVEKFLLESQQGGWSVHPVSKETMNYKTAWLCRKGVPTLIEVHQREELSARPAKVTRVEFPMENEHFSLFDGIGLGDVVGRGLEIAVVVDGQRFLFSEFI